MNQLSITFESACEVSVADMPESFRQTFSASKYRCVTKPTSDVESCFGNWEFWSENHGWREVRNYSCRTALNRFAFDNNMF